MPSHPGLFQHLGCCRKVPGVHNPLEEHLGPSGQLTRRFQFFKKLFFSSPLAFLFSLHLWQLKVVKRKKKKSCFVLLPSMNPLLCDGTAS